MSESKEPNGPYEQQKEPYKTYEPRASKTKAYIQFGIGGLVVILIIINVVHAFVTNFFSIWRFIFYQPILHTIGTALAYSAGIDLAYMLFTEAPDEAITPAILGISAAILILVSGDGINSDTGLTVVFLAIAIVVLAIASYFLFRRNQQHQRPPQS